MTSAVFKKGKRNSNNNAFEKRRFFLAEMKAQ
jgi:hypothetical protein